MSVDDLEIMREYEISVNLEEKEKADKLETQLNVMKEQLNTIVKAIELASTDDPEDMKLTEKVFTHFEIKDKVPSRNSYLVKR
ncbi:unnamed protein product [Auanema sp. JU1783]|nr:unnamed protein product [Auanema sp. JU1783]